MFLSSQLPLMQLQFPLEHLLRLVLRGLGGMGKRQLAVEFVRQHHRQFNLCFD
jgi:hypothetical protein